MDKSESHVKFDFARPYQRKWSKLYRNVCDYTCIAKRTPFDALTRYHLELEGRKAGNGDIRKSPDVIL